MLLTDKKVLLFYLVSSVVINLVALSIVYGQIDEVRAVENFNQAEKHYPLLSKRVLKEAPQDLTVNFYDLRKQLFEQTAPYEKSFGLYFEYLPTGTSIGINSNDEFYAASLFKVPVIMAYYHGMDRLGIKDDPIITLQPDQLDSEFGDLWKKGAGYQLKASEAVKLALVESDNTAAKALVPYITAEDFSEVYNGIDLDLRADQKGALVSVRDYSSVLKALYFSSVLSKETSQKMLDLLSKTKFSDKLVAGVPDEIMVAHKIGNFIDDDGNKGFRDCGIVYASSRPYILCMFSLGDETLARDRMQRASKTIYDYVSRP
jgi:beta-lactamase class A